MVFIILDIEVVVTGLNVDELISDSCVLSDGYVAQVVDHESAAFVFAGYSE